MRNEILETTRTSRLRVVSVLFVSLVAILANPHTSQAQLSLSVGFAETDVTPKIGKTPVWMAGFGQNRSAKGVHDPLKARVIVASDGKRKIALASVDLVGLFHSSIQRVRKKLPGFDYVLVSSTHNHEGPDTMGIWGPNPFQSGVDGRYLTRVESQIVAAINKADQSRQTATAVFGAAHGPELLHDSRLPIVKHDELTVLAFDHAKTKKRLGIVVVWHCHPETLGSKFRHISADFVGPAVDHLQNKHKCPVVWFSGTVGGLMTSLRVPVKDDKGKALQDATWEKTERYGKLVGRLADKAIAAAKSTSIAPIHIQRKSIFLPIDNPLYNLAWRVGVVQRDVYHWKGDLYRAVKLKGEAKPKARMALKTEVGLLTLGDVQIAAIPGEIYPELVLGKVQTPVDPGADFPKASIEPSIYAQMKKPHRMLIGLANDEIGYIIPKRQWDKKAPFCYKRKRGQYGEINSLGPETAPLICRAFRDAARGK